MLHSNILRTEKMLQFVRKNSRRAWHVIPAREVEGSPGDVWTFWREAASKRAASSDKGKQQKGWKARGALDAFKNLPDGIYGRCPPTWNRSRHWHRQISSRQATRRGKICEPMRVSSCLYIEILNNEPRASLASPN